MNIKVIELRMDAITQDTINYEYPGLITAIVTVNRSKKRHRVRVMLTAEHIKQIAATYLTHVLN